MLRADFQNRKANCLPHPFTRVVKTFFAQVQILEHRDHHDLSEEELLAVVPEDYDHSFFFVVDRTGFASSEFSDPCRRLDSRRLRGQFKACKTIHPLPT